MEFEFKIPHTYVVRGLYARYIQNKLQVCRSVNAFGLSRGIDNQIDEMPNVQVKIRSHLAR